ncbi:hypothetical protein Q5752_002229 [Cryptotrichosporon argae]
MASTSYLPNWSVRAISTPGSDTDLSLFVSFDNARFLFGAGEGTQRAFVQKKTGMRGLAAVFLPGGQHAGRDGLPGVLMTTSDMGIKSLAIVGPPDTAHYLSTFRGSVIRDAMRLDVHAFPDDSTAPSEEIFKSPSMTVRAVALRPSSNAIPGTGELSSSTTEPSSSTKTPPGSPFRPALLPRPQLRSWTSQIVGDMFRLGSSRPSLPPLVNRASAPDDRFPLPLPADADVRTDMVYVCQAPDVRGKFDVAKAKLLRVPNGPMRGRLTKGETIEFDDETVPGGKRTVRPEDCLVGGGPGAVLIVVNCSEINVERLIESTAFEKHQTGHGHFVPVHCIVHRVSPTVWRDERYQTWMSSFGDMTHHLVADVAGDNRIFFTSTSWNMLQLSLLDPSIFNVPHHALAPVDPAPLPARAERLIPNHVVRMHPLKPPEVAPNHDKDRTFPMTPEELAAARESVQAQLPGYASAVEAALKSVRAAAARRAQTTGPGDDIVVTTLGTGSAIPSKYRNVSSTHLAIPGTGGVLLDAGEGTLGQLRRRFGPSLPAVYAELKMVFISHMHADHHLGLAAILADRFRTGVTGTLYVVAPYAIALQLSESASWQVGVDREALENVVFINITRLRGGWAPRREEGESQDERDSRDTERQRETSVQAAREASPSAELLETAADEEVRLGVRKWPFHNVFRFHPETNRRQVSALFALLSDLHLSFIQAPAVEHRGAAFGLVLAGAGGADGRGWRLVYSGDTKPSAALVEAGRGADLLIHEATLEDDKPEVAAVKGHSTFSQAINVGREMGARAVLLNHFSQRYPKIPVLPTAAADAATPTVSISFDLMSVRVGDMWKMAHYMDALGVLYAELEKEDSESVADDDEADAKGAVAGAGDKEHKSKGAVKAIQAKQKAAAEGDVGVVGKKAQRRAWRQEAKKAKGEDEVREAGTAHGKRPSEDPIEVDAEAARKRGRPAVEGVEGVPLGAEPMDGVEENA